MNRPGVGLIRGPGRDWSIPMIRLFCLIVALGNGGQGAAEPTDWMKPSNWTENFWGRLQREPGSLENFRRCP